jgi:hypothetical protein
MRLAMLELPVACSGPPWPALRLVAEAFTQLAEVITVTATADRRPSGGTAVAETATLAAPFVVVPIHDQESPGTRRPPLADRVARSVNPSRRHAGHTA